MIKNIFKVSLSTIIGVVGMGVIIGVVMGILYGIGFLLSLIPFVELVFTIIWIAAISLAWLLISYAFGEVVIEKMRLKIKKFRKQ